MPDQPPYRVLIAEDHPLYRRGLRLLVEMSAGMEVVAEAKDGCEAVELAARHHPDVVIMDVDMPLMTGIEATERIRAIEPASQVLIVSAARGENVVTDALLAGAKGFVAKGASSRTITQAIRRICTGGTFLAPAH